MFATGKQIAYLARLAEEAGFEHTVAAVTAYGFLGKSASDLTTTYASDMIDWLKSGAAPTAPAQEIELGTRFSSAAGPGKVITLLSDGRVMVKFDDGRSEIVERAAIVLE